MPPITSTTTSTSVAVTSASASVVNSSAGTSTSRCSLGPADGDADQLDGRADARREVVGLLVQQPRRPGCRRPAAEQRQLSGRADARHHGSPFDRRPSALHLRHRAASHDTCPVRSRDVRRVLGASADVGGEQVVLGLPAQDERRDRRRAPRPPGGAARGCSCWPSTGSRHRCPARRAGRRARRRRAANSSLTTMSPASQCLPTTRPSSGAASERRDGERAAVVGVVESGADVVAHAAVDRDVGAHGAGVELDLLDGARPRRPCTWPVRRSRDRARSTGVGTATSKARHSCSTILVSSMASCAGSDGSSWVV